MQDLKEGLTITVIQLRDLTDADRDTGLTMDLNADLRTDLNADVLADARNKSTIKITITGKGLCQNECFDTAPLRCVKFSKMQGIEDEGDRSLLE